MSAVINTSGTVKVIKVAAPKIERITVADLAGVANAEKLVRIVNAQTDAIATAMQRLPQQYIDFEDIVCTTANVLRLQHNFGGRVYWWVVRWTSTGTPLVDSAGDTTDIFSPMLIEDAATDENVLVLDSKVSGTATIRVAPRGV